ncbi:urea carboxylase, partial [Dickeya dadantii]|nr:urea carboxylase [Dickeya dadantii]
AALDGMAQALDATSLYGIETNLDWLRHLLTLHAVRHGDIITATLGSVVWQPATLDVLGGGTLTTVQDAPGRTGYWHVGVPPSGPFDVRSFRFGNQLLGNAPDAAGLEITLRGPTLRFNRDCAFVITGAAIDARLDDVPLAGWRTHHARAGQTLTLGDIQGAGCRSYLLLAGGLACPDVSGQPQHLHRLGKFGGHAGRALR